MDLEKQQEQDGPSAENNRLKSFSQREQAPPENKLIFLLPSIPIGKLSQTSLLGWLDTFI